MSGTPLLFSSATEVAGECRRSLIAMRSSLKQFDALGQNSEPSRPFDDTLPTITLAIGERVRLPAMGFGLSNRPSIVVSQHTLTDVSLADLADGGLMPYEVAQFLDAAILA